MTDSFDKVTRSRIMSRVRSKDTQPELRLRKSLFALGFRYRLHDKSLPGRPDLVFKRVKSVVFVHGCLWHWHGCSRSRMPGSNVEYWRAKIARNEARDRHQIKELREKGWRVLVVWECALTATKRDVTVAIVTKWLRSEGEAYAVIEPPQSEKK